MPFSFITFNIKSKVRHETMEGRDYLVAPMVMLTEGVHEGSSGKILYLKEDLEASAQAWNHMPIVVYHPEGGSARDPVILNSRKVGIVLNSKFDGKLRAEAWVEKSRAKEVDERVLDALENSKMMELSTGLFLELDRQPDVWNGQAFDGTAHNMQPDHLALLPDKIGACSIEKGAGLLQLNSLSSQMLLNHKKSLEAGLLTTILNQGALKNELFQNELSFSSIQGLIYSILREKLGDKWQGWTEDVFDSYFVYSDGGKLLKQKYLADDTGVSFVDSPEQVTRVVSYQSVGAPALNQLQEKEVMAKANKKTVDSLIANKATKWEESDRDYLMNQTEEQLEKFAPAVAAANADDTNPPPAPPAAPPVVPPAAPVGNEQKPVTFNEWMASAPPAFQQAVHHGLNVHNQERAKLIQIIAANEANTFTPEQLANMDFNQLSSVAAFAQAAANAKAAATTPIPNTFPSYLGQAAGFPVANASGANVEEPLVAPTMNFSKG